MWVPALRDFGYHWPSTGCLVSVNEFKSHLWALAALSLADVPLQALLRTVVRALVAEPIAAFLLNIDTAHAWL